MTPEEIQAAVKDNLCLYDPESSYYEDLRWGLGEEISKARNDCACDKCFYGKDKLAQIIREQQKIIKQLKESEEQNQ